MGKKKSDLKKKLFYLKFFFKIWFAFMKKGSHN